MRASSARGRGIAAALLAAAEAEARGPARAASAARAAPALALYERAGYTPYGERFDDAGIEHLAWGSAGMDELRVDPLTGLKSIIAAGDALPRARRRLPREPADPVDPEKDPFLEGHEDRTPPEVYALRPGGGEPDTPGWRVRVVPNLYPGARPGQPAAASPSPSPTCSPSRRRAARTRS